MCGLCLIYICQKIQEWKIAYVLMTVTLLSKDLKCPQFSSVFNIVPFPVTFVMVSYFFQQVFNYFKTTSFAMLLFCSVPPPSVKYSTACEYSKICCNLFGENCTKWFI